MPLECLEAMSILSDSILYFIINMELIKNHLKILNVGPSRTCDISYESALMLELSSNSKLCDEKGVGMLTELRDILQYTGNYEPLEQIFVTTKNMHNVSLFLFLFSIAHVGRLQHSKNTDSLLPKSFKDNIDCVPLIMGLLTILQQFHRNVKMLYISYMSQYVVTVSEAQLTDKEMLGPEVVTMLHFLQTFVRMARLPMSVLEQRIPNIILSEFDYLAMPVK